MKRMKIQETNSAKGSVRAVPSAVWAIAALAVILLFNLIFTQNFFTVQVRNGHLYGSLIDILYRASPIIMMAIGMTLVIATKGIDISVSSVAAISGSLAAVLIVSAHAPIWAIICVPLSLALIIGAWNGTLVSFLGIQPIIATLILMTTGRGIAMLITDGQIVVFHNKAFEVIGNGYLFGLPFSISICAILLVVILLLTRKTSLGLFIESLGINQKASRYSGINVKLIIFLVYVVSGLCAGMAGLFYCSGIKAADANNAALYTEMDAILAVVIGGTSMDGGKFSIVGSVFGALVMQALTTTILTRGVPVEVTLVVKALVVFALILLQSAKFRTLLLNTAINKRAA